MRIVARVALAFWTIGCLWHAPSQTAGTDLSQLSSFDSIAFERFFREVAQLSEVARNVSSVVSLNGQPSKLTTPTAQDAIGLTNEESRTLKAVASLCETRIRSFEEAARPLVFEARLQLIESETSSLAIERLNSLDLERQQILSACIQRLRTAFGDTRFKLVEDFVLSRKQGDSFFPLVSQKH
jgi:hypothetical protein